MTESERPTSTPGPEPTAARPRRAQTILGRLSQAVREQNWFAVLLEVVIVIVGVVIGFQVSAWGNAQSDRAKERTYLGQLVADLHETERGIADTEVLLATPTRATGELLRAFRSPERPERDSLMRWLSQFRLLRVVQPVMGTVQALVSTGDLALIRNDSLRSAITSYAQRATAATQSQHQWIERERDARRAFYERVDINEVEASVRPPAELDSVARAEPIRGLQTGARRQPFPVTVESVLTDRAVYNSLLAVSIAKRNTANYRQEMLGHTRALREHVEAELERLE